MTTGGQMSGLRRFLDWSRCWRGTQLLAALVPLAAVGIASVTTGIGLGKGQNLAPLLLIFGMLVSLDWLGLAAFVRARMAA